MSVLLISIAAFVFVATLVAGLYFVTRDLGKTWKKSVWKCSPVAIAKMRTARR